MQIEGGFGFGLLATHHLYRNQFILDVSAYCHSVCQFSSSFVTKTMKERLMLELFSMLKFETTPYDYGRKEKLCGNSEDISTGCIEQPWKRNLCSVSFR